MGWEQTLFYKGLVLQGSKQVVIKSVSFFITFKRRKNNAMYPYI